MPALVPEEQLPVTLSFDQVVDLCYAGELAQIAGDLARGLPVLVECEKDLAPFVFLNVRNRLKTAQLKCLYLDGRPTEQSPELPHTAPQFATQLLIQLRAAVRGSVEKKVLVLPHLDVITTSEMGLTTEAREIIPLLYENPELVWLGFKDPSFTLPPVIEQLFPHHYRLLGLRREKLGQLVTRSEARKFGKNLNPWSLYKYVSGLNPVRLRKLLATLEGEDYPANPRGAYQQIRQATRSGDLEIPQIDLERDIGGYPDVKRRIRQEILDILAHKDNLTDMTEVAQLEALLPRGLIFWGPPGTGKTLFAKALATALGAAITVVSGPELKSRWVGESEQNLRQIFHHARQSAPSIIVFDELDSFASARGTYTGSGVEHSMVNQLLTEMDGFRGEELVFVVGTTNFVEVLDPALLRPGRFEFQLHIPYPDRADRWEILDIYNQRMKLELTPLAIERALDRTEGTVIGAAQGTHYSGDHLHALCRSLARLRLREQHTGPIGPELVERALTEWAEPKPART